MLKRFIFAALLLCIGHAASAQQQSSISPSLPANGQPYSSSVIRGQFQAAINDIDRLMGLNEGASAPFTCNLAALGQAWLNTSTTPYTLSYCDGTGTWIAQDYWDVTNHIVTPPTGRGVCQSITAATTTDLGSVPQSCITVTGNSGVSITSFGSTAKAGDVKFVVFSGSNTVTYNATSLILPSAANLSTGAGTVIIAEALGSGNWQVFVAQGSGGGSSVTSFNGRTGVVVPATNDYNFNQLAGTIAYSQLVAPLQAGTANYIPYWASSAALANGSPTTIAQNVLPAIAAPGTGTNVACSLTAAGASITCTADGFVVCSALTTANCAEIGAINQTFNGGTTGAGGMDTGALPSSGWVAIYLIFNPSTQSVALLGYNCSSSCATLYPGTHAVSGYTMSALLTTLPTNNTPALVPGYVRGKTFQYQTASTVLNASTTGHASLTSLSVSGAVPPNATSLSGGYLFIAGGGGGGSLVVNFAADGTGTVFPFTSYVNTSNNGGGSLPPLLIATAQTIFYSTTNVNTNNSLTFSVAGYTVP